MIMFNDKFTLPLVHKMISVGKEKKNKTKSNNNLVRI